MTEHGPGPITDRPIMFGKAGLDPVLLPWSWAVHRLATARNYWIASTRPDGRPHTRPVWGIWHADAVYFSTGSLAITNLAQNPNITVHLESGAEVVIVESVAHTTDDVAELRPVALAYNAKYQWDLDPEHPDTWYVTRPQVAFGWIADDSGLDGGAAFHGTTTRWRFPT
jgi:hypothetical protein